MLGGGIYVTQNKTLPGSYINVVNASSADATVGERGVVAIGLKIATATAGQIITLTKADFTTKCSELLGVEYTDASVAPLREIFCHASKVYLYVVSTTVNEDMLNALESYDFNILCYTPGMGDEMAAQFISKVKSWRDELGKKCQVVVYQMDDSDHEGVINVVSEPTTSKEIGVLCPWVAGAMAGCAINESCTNMLYDGEYTIKTAKTQAELEECIANGQIAFHNVYGEVRLLEDINSLVTTTADKGEDFKSNQTIRVIDQIANDIAKLFNTKYLGKIPNNASGRVSLWGDIVKHHRELEAVQAIENFDATLLTVEQGATKKSVVVNDVITVVNAMAQLYMTLVVQ